MRDWGLPLVKAGILFLLLWPPPGVLANSADDIRARGALRVGMSGDYQPFSLCRGEGEDCQGFDVDVARRLAGDLGVRLEIVRFRWPDLRNDLAAGKFDITMSGVTMRPERALGGTFTRPYVVSKAVVLVADKDRFSALTGVNQAGVRLAVNAGGHLEQIARVHFPQATIIPTAKNLSLPQQVETRQADGLLTDSLEAPHFLAVHPALSALPAFGRDRKAYLLRRTDVALREWLDNWLSAHAAEMDLLRPRWFGPQTENLSTETSLFALMDLRLALMPAVAEYKRQHDLPIEDLAQETAVLERADAQARGTLLDHSAVRELFRVQIELAKQVQRATLRGQIPLPAWAHDLDLNADLRPVFLELGDRIVQDLALVSSNLKDPQLTLQWAEEEITTVGVSEEAKRQLGEALWSTKGGRQNPSDYRVVPRNLAILSRISAASAALGMRNR